MSKILYLILTVITVRSVQCRTFGIVVDTTVSMEDELEVIKNNLPAVARSLGSSDFDNYLVVPFNDPGVETPISVTKPAELVQAVNSLRAAGGSDCPEDSLAGIQTGLEMSQPDSYLYVFTDAYAKYNRNFGVIEELCKRTRSQVIVFLSGNCSALESKYVGDTDVYYDIARVCSGAVFRLDAFSLKKAFRYIKAMVNADYNEIENHAETNGFKQFTFTVDPHTTELLLVVSGDYPILQIVDSKGKSPPIETLVNMRQSLVIRISNLQPGQYRASARCQGPTFVTFYKRNRVSFHYGFSTRMPNSLKETSPRPMPGWTNYIFIKLHDNYNIRIDSMELEFVDTKNKTKLSVTERANYRGCYISTVFVEPDKSFKIAIIGKNPTTYEEIMESSKIINPQKQVQATEWRSPTSEIITPDSKLVDYKTNATFACKVTGYPKPRIWWEDDQDDTLVSEDILLEIPSTYISYVSVHVTSNFTLYCKSENSAGRDTSNIELFVNRPFTFNIVQSPQDVAIEYGSSEKLYCEVDAYPEAEIKWYFNGTSIEYNDNIVVLDYEHAIEIKNMTLNDVGTYKCEASNVANKETVAARITISGLDKPELQASNSVEIFKPGDWADLQCTVIKGNPTPKITWQYMSDNDDDFGTKMPNDVFREGDKLKIPAVSVIHKGTYRCIGTNMMGEGFDDITLKIQYAPKVTISNTDTLTVREEDIVELPCEVDAVPTAKVEWIMTRDDKIVPFDHRHRTNDYHTHKFLAESSDSGKYYCIAENVMGRTEKSISVNVLVAPYIQPADFTEVTVATGKSLNLTCVVLFGNPVPSTRWEFLGLDSASKVLSRGDTTNILSLPYITKANEGKYICVAENDIGNDRIRIVLKVK